MRFSVSVPVFRLIQIKQNGKLRYPHVPRRVRPASSNGMAGKAATESGDLDQYEGRPLQ